MSYTKRFLMAAGAIALAVLLGSLATPKATHALVAALVQVTNTISNPVPVQEVTRAASQLVDITCDSTPPGGQGSCIVTTEEGANGGYFVVPAGQHLVITTLDIVTGEPTGGITIFELTQTKGAFGDLRDQFTVSNSNVVTQLQYPSGIVIPSGYQIGLEVEGGIFEDCPDCHTVRLSVRGYLTAN